MTDALLRAVMRWAGSHATVLRLWVAETAAPARRFYERNGFVLTGRTRELRVLGLRARPDDGGLLEMARPLPEDAPPSSA